MRVEPADPLNDPHVRSAIAGVDVDTVIVGAGISGICTGVRLLQRQQRSFVLLEAKDDLGGTWRENTYPGVAVDIPSISYSFSFKTDFGWTRHFAPGREIQAYVRQCAQEFGVTPHIRYASKVVCARFDPGTDTWATHLDGGAVIRSRYLVAATGLLSQPKLPEIKGLASFSGKAMHTARWDHAHSLEGARVAIIGTGASAVQIIPAIAPDVAHLSVFQRTPAWIAPRPDYRLNPESAWAPRRLWIVRALLRFFSELSLELLTCAIVNYQRFPYFVRGVAKLVRWSMRRQIDDPELARLLVPTYGLGCKRPATSNTYLRAFNRDNVCLITAPIERITPEGVVTEDGAHHRVDTLVLATGFLTTEQGNGPSFQVHGMDGVELGQYWDAHRLQSYAGVSMPGFPNFFLTAGPYAGGFNWFAMIEAHVAQIMRCMDRARAEGATRVDVSREAHARYMQHMWRRAERTIFKDDSCAGSNSYYQDRHGDASLPLPRTPWWRLFRNKLKRTRDYDFGHPDA